MDLAPWLSCIIGELSRNYSHVTMFIGYAPESRVGFREELSALRRMVLIPWLYASILGTATLNPSVATSTATVYSIPNTTLKRRGAEDTLSHAVCLSNDNLDAYSPQWASCPGDDFKWIRPADTLDSSEQKYLEQREPKLRASWSERMKASDLKEDLPRTPVVALALSGGGYRAMISGSGMAFQPNKTAGSAGDLLAVSSYVSGLSGGSWALSSFYSNNGLEPMELAKDVGHVPYNASILCISDFFD